MRTHLLHAVFLIMLTPSLPCIAAEGETGRLGTLHRQILEILHGEPRTDVIPSPYYCFRRGLGSDDTSMQAFDWYHFGKGKCGATYAPNLASILSPLSDGGSIRHFISDEAKCRRLEDSLTQLATNLETTPPSLGDRFDLQMTFWELVAALQFSRDIRTEWDPKTSQTVVDRLLVPALRALRASLFTPEQVASLPATLSNLAELSSEPTIEPWAQRLLAGDETILEDLFPGQLHGSFAQGRLFGRAFITVTNSGELERLRSYLNQRDNLRLEGFSWQSTPPLAREKLKAQYQADLVSLPLRYSGLHTILVLFFNVLDTRYKIVPTKMVAGWQELWLTAKLENQKDLRAIDRVTGMRVVNYQKQLGLRAALGGHTSFPIYRSHSEDAVSRILFTDVNPVFPGANVTTARAQCLTCHNGKVRTYGRKVRKAGFAKPFLARSDELYDRYMEVEAEEALKRWALKYLGDAAERP